MLDGGEIRGIPVKIVQRKVTTSSSDKPLFNYLWNGKIISKIDFLSCNPFELVDGNEKASAYGANGTKYWIMPSGRRLLYCSRQKLKENMQHNLNKTNQPIRLTESDLRKMVEESVKRALEEERNRRLEESIGKSLHQIINEYTRKTVRT